MMMMIYMFRVLQIKCRAQVSGERERDVKISKRFSIGCILTIDKNFLLLLFFYCFRIMYDNRCLEWESWKIVFSLLLVKDWCLFLIQWDWSCLVDFLSNGVEIDFVTPSLGIASDLKSCWTRFIRRGFRPDVARSNIAWRCWWCRAREKKWIGHEVPSADSLSCSRRCFLS